MITIQEAPRLDDRWTAGLSSVFGLFLGERFLSLCFVDAGVRKINELRAAQAL